MLNQLENLAKCVADNNEFIDLWLQAHKRLLVAYYYLIGLKPNKEKHTPSPGRRRLDAFCYQLVDYLSAGHFHVDDRIVPEGETTFALIYSALQENTRKSWRFTTVTLQALSTTTTIGHSRNAGDDAN